MPTKQEVLEKIQLLVDALGVDDAKSPRRRLWWVTWC